jgi:hypothetical protein
MDFRRIFDIVRRKGWRMVHVLGVSMPRSGHHLFEVILKNCLGTNFGYCEFYYEPDCCRQIPCGRKANHYASSSRLFLQKSHDFELSDPVEDPGPFRVVQYRSSVLRSLSQYELLLRRGVPDNEREFRHFLVSEAIYFCLFHKKWLSRKDRGFFILTYEELTADPIAALTRFFSHVELEFSASRLRDAVRTSVSLRGRDGTRFVQSQLAKSRYANHPVLANFEDIVIRNCDGYFPMRYFPEAEADKSLIGLIFRAMMALRSGDGAEALSFAEQAQAQDPEDPKLKNLVATTRKMPNQPVQLPVCAAS